MRFIPFALAACLIVAIVLSVVWGKPDPPSRLALTSVLPEEQIDDCLRIDNFVDRHGLSLCFELRSSRAIQRPNLFEPRFEHDPLDRCWPAGNKGDVSQRGESEQRRPRSADEVHKMKRQRKTWSMVRSSGT